MGHAEPQATSDVKTDLQHYWMPFSANKEFKSEPRLFARAARGARCAQSWEPLRRSYWIGAQIGAISRDGTPRFPPRRSRRL